MMDHKNAQKTQDVYDQIIAEKFEYEKKLIRQELQKYGIYSVYTLPENLSIEVINKYLEIKSQGNTLAILTQVSIICFLSEEAMFYLLMMK